jgi:hypothetical protein
MRISMAGLVLASLAGAACGGTRAVEIDPAQQVVGTRDFILAPPSQ